jgi:LPXTG-motif cell wall-anchored protein
MKQIKRIMAFALALVLTLAMSITVFADETKKPEEDDTATITVKNVETGADVYAYKYVQANYNDSGLYGYSIVTDKDGKKIVDINDVYAEPSAEDIVKLVEHTSELASVKLDYNDTDGTYFKNVEAGSYLILVTNTTSNIYNPMVVSVSYDDQLSGSSNILKDGSVSASETITLADQTVYAKSSTPSVKKEITGVYSKDFDFDPDDSESSLPDEDSKEDGKVYDAAIGDLVEFQITTTIPSYSEAYTKNGNNITFDLYDSMDPAFELIKIEGISVDNESVDFKEVKSDEENDDDSENTLIFDENLQRHQYAKGVEGFVVSLGSIAEQNYNKTTNVVITYLAKLTDKAAVSKNGKGEDNTNNVTLKYSSSPMGDINMAWDETYSYTYKIDSLITKLDGNNDPLPGATFTLTGGDDNHTYTEKSDEKGHVNFTGLDQGTYTLKETAAPDGYSLNDTEYTVNITPTYTDGKVTNVEIKFTGGDVEDGDSITITDTNLASLPSTGGIGTTIFTIAGCLIMITAAGMYFASRRKSAK